MSRLFSRRILFLAAAWIFSMEGRMYAATGKGDTLIFQRFNINSGLSSDNLKALFQDREGYLWIATDNGINRFDGYKTTVYKPEFAKDNSFNSVDFNSIAEDKKGDLWFGTDHSGINIFNKLTQKVTIIDQNTPNGLAIISNNINHLFCDSKGRIWISSLGGLNLFFPDKNKMITFSDARRPGKTNPSGQISYVYEDRHGKILVGSWGNGLYIYDEQKDDFIHILIPKVPGMSDYIHRVVKILEDRQGNYWLGTWEGGLFKTQLNNYRSIKVLQYYSENSKAPFTLSSDIIYCLYEDKAGSIWAGTPYGLNIIKNHNSGKPEVQLIQSGNSPSKISQNDIFSILQDRSGIIWLATSGGGLNKFDPGLRSIDAYKIPEIISSGETQSIRSFFLDSDSSLLIGVQGLGLGKYILSENKFIPCTFLPKFRKIAEDLVDINAATCFHLDKDKNLWIGTRYRGLYIISAKTGATENFLSFDSVTGTQNRAINVIYEDKFKHVWVGSNKGLFEFVPAKGGTNKINRYLPIKGDSHSLSGEYISAIFEDSESNLWIGTLGGALNVARNTSGNHYPLSFKHYFPERDKSGSIKSNIVYSIMEDKKKRLWIGTGTAGLALFNRKDETFSHFSKEEGIVGDAVFDIIEERGNLWLTTSNGLVRFRSGNTGEYQAELFTTEDGLNGNVFIDGASFKSPDGRIFVGGYYGFNVINPAELSSNPYIPPIVITGIWIGNEKVNVYDAMKNGLDLNYNQNNINIEFAALSYSQPGKNKYAYLLEGLDAVWKRTNSEGRMLNYSHIPPGTYTLRLKASNNSDIWNEIPMTLSIRVRPHPAKSWWAILLYSIIVISILIAIYYFLINNIKIKQAYEIEKLERIKEENINQFKFRFFTNISHELLTPLSVLSFSVEDLISKMVLDSERLKIMERNVNRVMHLISQLLDFRKVESGSMMPVVLPGRIDTFIEQICICLKPLADKKQISVIVNGNGEQTIYFDPDKMDKIVCNLLSNALRYTPENGKIIINYKLYEKDDSAWLKLEVIDSGKGIEPENLGQVFERFYQVKSVTGKTFGAGIGLALSKNLVENHKGFMTVQNEENMGAKFSVDIPVSDSAYSHDEIRNEEINYQSGTFIIDHDASLLPVPAEDLNTTKVDMDGKKTILIVEDNSDFRQLLNKHLSNYYNTLEAGNGEQGYEICLQKHPDLVITDMMMPVMNGIEMCNKIKNNIETSHIIVILLTAKTDEETRYESYLANADSYIAKPVDVRTLYTRVESLLAQREKIIMKYAHGSMPVAVESEYSAMDAKFLENVKSVIESRLLNTELNVLALSKEIGMSTSSLYRKIVSLTNMSPVEFIRYIRLQSAANMMVKEGANVSEAAYASGFNDLSYFSKSFKKQFGVSPKKYVLKPFHPIDGDSSSQAS
ncbi:MAG: two-component regulator propeller domain-containing protein [Bacteroidales bacterium]|nr:two-component regulator propeller domain-containing protein [Bacteroidales bacterium]